MNKDTTNSQNNNFKINKPTNGIFWLIDNILVPYPFGSIDSIEGIAKSGNTYNHKRLWNDIKPAGTIKPYNYYPRGRVVINSKGKATIYMSPHISIRYVEVIKQAFRLINKPRLIYDNSEHYKCFLDNGWKANY